MSRSLLSREDRAGVLALRRREGLSFRELSAATAIREATLRMWERRERVSRRSAKFVEVEVPVPSTGRSLELVVGERIVRLPLGFDAGELRRLLSVLEQPC
jgi:hypothetical protein